MSKSERSVFADSFKPTEGMVSEAKRGLAWRKEFGRGGTSVGIARARDISNGKNLSLSTVKRMFSFFSRHEVDKKGKGFKPSGEGYPSNGRIAWALWGGDAGFSWSRKIVNRQKKLEEKKMPIPYRLKDEEEQVFIDRCMTDKLMSEEFPVLEDRFAVCSVQSRYEDKKKDGLSRLRVGFRKGSDYKVNASEGVMTEISLIEVGEARGHDLFIDETSLETALDVIGDNLPAYITHEGALEDDRILREVGVFSDFFIEGDKLKAKRFKALESFRDDEKVRFNRLFDIASEMPDTFGVSLVFEALVVYVTKDGTEVPVDELSLDDREASELVRESPSVRFVSIKSADFVDAPASNRKGLFSIHTKQNDMTDKIQETEQEEEVVEEKLEESSVEETPEESSEEISIEDRISGLEERISAQDEEIKKLNGELSEAHQTNETLSALIEGEEALEESVSEEVESVSLVEQFAKAQGAEATELFRKHRKEIRASFNSQN